MDALRDRFKGTLWQFNIERPQLFKELNEDFRELTSCVVEAVEAKVRSSRAFFKDTSSLADHIHKVPHWETQSDKIASRIQQTIFRQEDLPLSHKMQLRDLIKHVDKIADRAEDVSDKRRRWPEKFTRRKEGGPSDRKRNFKKANTRKSIYFAWISSLFSRFLIK
jgi:uncharacterized protein Yka (UPF0111/DUF47 family)